VIRNFIESEVGDQASCWARLQYWSVPDAIAAASAKEQ